MNGIVRAAASSAGQAFAEREQQTGDAFRPEHANTPSPYDGG